VNSPQSITIAVMNARMEATMKNAPTGPASSAMAMPKKKLTTDRTSMPRLPNNIPQPLPAVIVRSCVMIDPF